MSLKNRIYIILGFIFLFLGGIGIILPVLPTTPFVLLAAGCFANNKRMSDWLKKSKLFGEYITNYQERNGLSRKTVIKSLSFLWITLMVSVAYIHSLWAAFLLPCIGIGVTTHILWIARPRDNAQDEKEHEFDK